jgi:hypothetical protein
MQRPLFDKSIDELESAFEQQRSDFNFLRTLLEELSKRKGKGRAATLKTKSAISGRHPKKQGSRKILQ